MNNNNNDNNTLNNTINDSRIEYLENDDHMYKDYIVVDQRDIDKIKTCYSYKDESSSIIKILTDSYNYLFRGSPKSI